MDISDEAKGQLLKSWDETLGKMSPDKLAKMSWADVKNAIKTNLAEAGIEAEEEMESVFANVKE
jgi:hypothetical protein